MVKQTSVDKRSRTPVPANNDYAADENFSSKQFGVGEGLMFPKRNNSGKVTKQLVTIEELQMAQQNNTATDESHKSSKEIASSKRSGSVKRVDSKKRAKLFKDNIAS